MKLYPHVSLFFSIWLVSILLISYFGFLRLPHSGTFGNNFFQSFSNWDGGHYLGIAEFGYSEKFQYAFFPLYPMLVRFLNGIIGSFFWSGVIVSLICSFLGIQLFYKLALLYFDKTIAKKVILLLLVFPTSFYFLTAYSEGLFFLLVVASFLFFKKSKFLYAAIFVSLASVTRIAGLGLVLALILEIQITTGFNKKNWFILLSPLGFLIYCFYLFNQTGDPFYFLQAELHWQRSLTIPYISFWETIKSLSIPGFAAKNFNALLDLGFAVFGVGLTIRSFRFLPPAFCIYALISVLFPLFTPTLSSIPRFLLPIFPIFMLLANIKKEGLIFGYQLISTMLLAVFTILFVCGYWVS